MIREYLALHMPGVICFLDTFNTLAETRRVVDHITLQDSRYMRQKHFRDHMTPSLFQEKEAPFFEKNMVSYDHGIITVKEYK